MAAPSGLIVGWPSTAASIPAGWSRVAAMDSRMPKASTATGSTGGATTHTHTIAAHSHTDSHAHGNGTSSGPSAGGVDAGTSSAASTNSHTHGTTYSAAANTSTSNAGGATSSGGNLPNTYTVIWIQSNGTTDIPSGAVAWTALTSAPTGWAFMDGSGASPDIRQYFLYGAATGVDGGTQTAASAHTHTYSHNHGGSSHTHPWALAGDAGGAADGTSGSTNAAAGHTHTGGTSNATSSASTGADATASGSATPEPAYTQLNHIKSSVQAAAPKGVIACIAGATPAGWAACNGTQGTPSLNDTGSPFVKGATSTGTTGGTGGGSSHTHTQSHTHTAPSSHTHTATGTSGTPSSTTFDGSFAGFTASSTHTHTPGTSGALSGWSASTNSTGIPSASADPPWYTVNFVMSLGPSTLGGPRVISQAVQRSAVR